MDDSLSLSECDHPQVIIHIDIDCFYAQVEMIRNPLLKEKPVGIQQKNFMVTCNYIARSLGVKKSMRKADALKILPDLVLVDGSDLTPYRHYSAEIFSILQTYTKSVEKLGLDENFIDVTDILDDYDNDSVAIEGNIFSHNEDIDLNFNECYCGCYKRLVKGSCIAKKIRDHIYCTLGITTCAGIAHNKLLAKLVSGFQKPNNQTVVFPSQVQSLMKSLTSPKAIPGIGFATYRILESLGIINLEDLQSCPVDTLNKKFDTAFSVRLKNLAIGIDNSKVKPSGPPQTLSIEDSFRKISDLSEAKCKLEILIERLLILLKEDGRFPKCLRLVVRKSFKDKLYGQRETKHVELHSSMFGFSEMVTINFKVKEELNKVALNLFNKLVSPSELNHLTLLGIGFTKFFDRATNTKSISQYFTKRLSLDKILPLRKKAKTIVESSTCKDVLDNSNNLNDSIVNLATRDSIIKYALNAEPSLCRKSFNENIFGTLPETSVPELGKTLETLQSPFSYDYKMDSLSKFQQISNLKSRNLKQKPLIKQKKIDSFFIVDNKAENITYTNKIVASTSSLDFNVQGNSTQDSGASKEQERQQLVNKGIDLSIFDELPQEIKEEILAEL